MYAAAQARAHPERAAFVMGESGEVVTYAQFEALANRIAHLFRASGLRRGDHVALFFENNPVLLECEGGAERTGLYYTCINSYLSADEVAYIVNDCGARVVVTSAAKRAVATELPARCPTVERWIMSDILEPDGVFDPLTDAIAPFPDTPVPHEETGAPMLYSSGTTGRPKGILRALPVDLPSAPNAAAVEFTRFFWGFREGMTYLSPAPLYHAAPQGAVSMALRFGATSVIMEHFDAARWLELVEQHRVTHSQLVPTMFIRLLKLPAEVRASADLSSLERIFHTAAPCPVPVKEQIIEWFGPIVTEYFASSEGNGVTHVASEDWLTHKGTVGKPVVGEILILDDRGEPCPPGTPGTIWFRGATSFEYHNDPEKTAASRLDEHTSTVGDIGYLDDDGYLYLTDRKSFMIISGGVNIYPQEVENLLVTHSKVLDVAVIGVPNDDLGEEVKAIVQPAPGAIPGAELERELIAFCRGELAHFKCPRSVDFTTELPRLPTGKLYKQALRQQYWQGRESSLI